MHWDNIKLVTEIISRLGSEEHLTDLSNVLDSIVIDYENIRRTGKQRSRNTRIEGRPFDHISPLYRSSTPFTPPLQMLEILGQGEKLKGPITCFDTLESCDNPFEIVGRISRIMGESAYLIVGGKFRSPFKPHSKDRWRFSPDGLCQLLTSNGLNVIESGWRLQIDTTHGVLSLDSGEPEEIFTCYAVGAYQAIECISQKIFQLPTQWSLDEFNSRSNIVPAKSDNPIHGKKNAHKGYTCLFLNTCYDRFLEAHYQKNPNLSTHSYADQLASINQTFFGDSNFYSKNLSLSGINSSDIIVNCAPLQIQWATENDFNGRLDEIVFEQIRRANPDVVYIQDMGGTSSKLLAFLSEQHVLIVGQIACEMTTQIPLSAYDIVFSSFVHYIPRFRAQGIAAYYTPLAYAGEILEVLPNTPFDERTISCSFIGGISSYHSKGTALLEKLCLETPIQVWGYGGSTLPIESPIAARHQGEAWGLDMFRLFTQSKITVNRHSEAAETNANNMRLYEATGCGSLLITDYKDNLNQLFSIGKEVVAYRSPEECISLVNYYLRHPEEAAKIAQAGQRRTLTDHSYRLRMTKTAEILKRHLDYRKNPIPLPSLSSISTDFNTIEKDQVSEQHLKGWQEHGVARSQRGLVQYELGQMYKGDTPIPFDVIDRALRGIVKNSTTVLEIGCSSGYYYEVLEYLLNKNIKYTGIDYSEAMIEMARSYYPNQNFLVGDGANLEIENHSFDLVISGCVLIHCPNYPAHIKETCRVAKDYILLHRTPISLTGGDRLFEKKAYGTPTVELWFDEKNLTTLFSHHGFKVVQTIQYEMDQTRGFAGITYLLKREL